MSAAPSPAPVRVPEPPAPAVEPAPRSRKPVYAAAVLVVVVAAVWFFSTRNEASSQPAPAQAAIRTARVATGTLERTIRLNGQTGARNFATVSAPILRGPESRGNMILLKVVPAGSRVQAGQIIAEIDAQSVLDHIDDVQDTVSASEVDVVKRRSEQQIEWYNLEQTLKVAKAEWEKAKLDYSAAEVRTDIERQLLRLALDEAEAKYRQSEKDLEFRREAQKAELGILDLTRKRHVRHRQRHEADLKRFTIKAPMNGLAVMATVWRSGDLAQIREGDQINPGQKILSIVDPDTMQVEANINQAESSNFRIGQEARIELDGFQGVTASGRVYSIGALATRGWRENYYIRSIPVRIRLDRQDPRIIPDLSASVSVVLERSAPGSLIPLGAVRSEGGKFYALVKTPEGFEKRAVSVGLRNDTHAVVTSGLSAGEEVRLN